MKRLLAAVFILFAWLVVLLHSARTVPAMPAAPVQSQDCSQLTVEFQTNPARLDQFLKPVITTEAQRKDRLAEAQKVYDCLQGGDEKLSQADLLTKQVMGLFLAFVGDAGFRGADRQIVKFAELQDPAIVQLRDEVNLPNPDSGSIFIWYFPSREAMPDVIRAAFPTSQVQGVTIGTRFIAVLTQGPINETPEQRRSRVGKIISHELVHAFINASYPLDPVSHLPTWYAEGLAIHFSGSSEPSSMVDFGPYGKEITYISFPPEDYAQYRDNFNYLETRYGRGQFMALIRRSVIERDPAVLLRGLGMKDEKDLVQQARAARIEQSFRRLGLILGGLLVAALLLAVMIRPSSLASGPLGHAYRGVLHLLYPVPDVLKMNAHGDIPGLIRSLDYENRHFPKESARARLAAVHALGQSQDERAALPLLKALKREEDEVLRSAVIASLGNFKREDVVDALLEPLEQGGPLSLQAADSLRAIGSPRAILPVLQRACHALGQEKHELNSILLRWHKEQNLMPAFCDLVHHPDALIRRETLEVLGMIQGNAALKLLFEAFLDPEPRVRQEALKLGAEHSGAAAASTLRAYYKNQGESLRLEAMNAITQARSELAVQLLAEILHGNDSAPLIFHAAACLGEIGGAQIVSALRPCMGSPLSIPWGQSFLVNGYCPSVLHLPAVIIQSLLKSRDESVIPEIAQAVYSPWEDVRKSAAFALYQIWNRWRNSPEMNSRISEVWGQMTLELLSLAAG